MARDDWAGYFSPTLQQDFVSKDSGHFHLFMDAINLYSICVNQKDPVVGGQAGLPVRLALSTSLDRGQIAQQATAGLEPPGSMTGLVLPTAQSWLAAVLAGHVMNGWSDSAAANIKRAEAMAAQAVAVGQITLVSEATPAGMVSAVAVPGVVVLSAKITPCAAAPVSP